MFFCLGRANVFSGEIPGDDEYLSILTWSVQSPDVHKAICVIIETNWYLLYVHILSFYFQLSQL